MLSKELKIIEDKVLELNWNHNSCYSTSKVIEMSAKMACKDKEELAFEDVLDIIEHLNSSLSKVYEL